MSIVSELVQYKSTPFIGSLKSLIDQQKINLCILSRSARATILCIRLYDYLIDYGSLTPVFSQACKPTTCIRWCRIHALIIGIYKLLLNTNI